MTQRAGRLDTGRFDTPPSAVLQQFMAQSWAEEPPPAPAALEVAPYAAKRRAALSGCFPGERLVVPAGHPKVRSNDQDHRFRPHSDYTYLTGDRQPEGVLVLEPGSASHRALLLMRPRAPRTGSRAGESYQDQRNGELWVGRRPTLAETAARLQLDCEHLERLPAVLGDRPGVPTRVLRGVDHAVDSLVAPPADPDADRELAAVLSELRLVKDEWEIAQLEAAVGHTVQAFAEVVRALPDAVAHRRGERWVEGIFNLRARAEGNGAGYEPIVAAGAHACVLHWNRNDGPLRPGELLLLDAGVEVDSLYTADVTRTMPISGHFTPPQRRVYDLVYEAHKAAMRVVRPGARFRDAHLAAMRVLAEGLEAWGVLRVPAEEALAAGSGLYRRYTICASGHMLGLDVHDCARARAAAYLDGVLEAGNVLTVEPGLYLQPDDLTLPEELRGTGVRIEDDVLVTADGCRNLSETLPRRAGQLERWMASLGA